MIQGDQSQLAKSIKLLFLNAQSYYNMIFLECNIRNLYISAPEHSSKMRIAPLDRAQKTIFSMFFLTSWCIMKYVYHKANKNINISNIKKLAV